MVLLFVTVWSVTALPAVTMAKALPRPDDRPFTPHKALYAIEMISRHSGSQIVNVSGQMFFEWKADCDAWLTDHRFNISYDYAETPPLHIKSDFTTYEPYDGQHFDFNSRRLRDGVLYEEVRGSATLPPDKTAGEAVFTIPEGLTYELAPGTFFPTAHILEILNQAQKGEKFVHAVLFDGTDEDGPVEVNAFIGDKVNPLAHVDPTKDIDTTLVNTQAWKVRMAFFPADSQGSDPDYEMDVVLHENGVVSDMTIYYRDFSITQKLTALEPLAQMACNSQKKVKKQK